MFQILISIKSIIFLFKKNRKYIKIFFYVARIKYYREEIEDLYKRM